MKWYMKKRVYLYKADQYNCLWDEEKNWITSQRDRCKYKLCWNSSFPLQCLTGVHTGFHGIGIGRWWWKGHCWYDCLTLVTNLYDKSVLHRSLWYLCCLNKSFYALIWVLILNKYDKSRVVRSWSVRFSWFGVRSISLRAWCKIW